MNKLAWRAAAVVCTRDVRVHAEAKDTAQGSRQRVSVPGALTWCSRPCAQADGRKGCPVLPGRSRSGAGHQKTTSSREEWDTCSSFRKWRDNTQLAQLSRIPQCCRHRLKGTATQVQVLLSKMSHLGVTRLQRARKWVEFLLLLLVLTYETVG